MRNRRLKYHCPVCASPLRPLQGMQVATQVVRRSCRCCGRRWQVIVVPVPLKRAAGFADVASFRELVE